jgi:porin
LRAIRLLALTAALGCTPAAGALAQAAGQTQPAASASTDGPDPAPTATPPSIQSSLGPYGDPGDLRALFAARGIAYSLTYLGETLGVASRGMRRGGIYEGRLDAQIDLDLEWLAGWTGAALHANAYQIHGRNLSRYYVGNLMTVSGIEALPSTRLYELWLEQKLFRDTVSVRAGQLAADTEFLLSQYAGLFVNATFGWPTITAVDLPNGGPAYPLATPGVRVKWSPTPDLTFMAAVFNGYPAGPGPGDPQINNRNGLEFRARDPAFLIGEAAYAYNQGKGAAGLPGTIKLGGWYHAAGFDHLRQAAPTAGATSLLLADPTGSGIARRLRGNEGAYAVLDQLLYRVEGTEDQGLAGFVRVSASPGDRNLVSVYADGGLTYKGVFPGRLDDTFGVSLAYAKISQAARGLDADTAFFNAGTFVPVRSSEALVEVTYQAQIVPGFTVQPDFQYVWRPGGGVINPRGPTAEVIKNAAILGVRAITRY